VLVPEKGPFWRILVPSTRPRVDRTGHAKMAYKLLIYKEIKECRWRESNPHPSCPGRDFESSASLARNVDLFTATKSVTDW
jgi:hypothetical protein